jgi:uncharacterized DUF497 family protein
MRLILPRHARLRMAEYGVGRADLRQVLSTRANIGLPSQKKRKTTVYTSGGRRLTVVYTETSMDHIRIVTVYPA